VVGHAEFCPFRYRGEEGGVRRDDQIGQRNAVAGEQWAVASSCASSPNTTRARIASA
jgi:hypothetical protein